MSGETHVQIHMATGQVAKVWVLLYPDETALFEAIVLDGGPPLLRIGHGNAEVLVWPFNPDQVTDTDIATARRLAEAAATYLADCERLHAE